MSAYQYEYEIWTNGYRVAEATQPPFLVGRARGDTFRAAVLRWFRENPDPNFDPVRLRLWGMSLTPRNPE